MNRPLMLFVVGLAVPLSCVQAQYVQADDLEYRPGNRNVPVDVVTGLHKGEVRGIEYTDPATGELRYSDDMHRIREGDAGNMIIRMRDSETGEYRSIRLGD